MSAKSFFYASAGIFLLVAAYTLGARHATADIDLSVQPVGFDERSGLALRADKTWWLPTPDGWQSIQDPRIPLPVDIVDNIVYWNDTTIIARGDNNWVWAGAPRGWVNIGPIPSPPTLSTTGRR